MSVNFKSQFDRLKADMAADKKKTAILGGLCMVLLVAVGRLLLPGEDQPIATAEATVATSSAALPRVDDALSPGKPTGPGAPPVAVIPKVASTTQMATVVPTPRRASKDAMVGARGSEDREPVVEASLMSRIPRTLARDPFDASGWRLRFGLPKSTPAVDGEKKSAFTFLNGLADQLASYQTQRAIVTKQLDDEIAALELRSTMTGSVKSAYISGQLVHEGDEIAGFSVVRIEAGRVVLSKFGIQRVLSVP